MRLDPREEELGVRALLENQELIDVYLKQKRWREVAALVRFARRDAPIELAQTDPALYRRLREQITRFFLRGGGILSLKKIEQLARRAKTRRDNEPGKKNHTQNNQDQFG